MFNDIKIGPLTFHMYGIMIALGFIMALILTTKRGKKKGFDEDTIYGIFYCAIIGGMLGTKILYWIVSIPEIIENPAILLDFKNGYVVYGGIIGGILTAMVYVKKHKKQAFIPYFDLVMPAVSLGQAFGRLGCFFAGCCYGRETDSWFSITFKNSDFAPNGVKLIPTQLISSAGDFVIFLILLAYAKKEPKGGRVGAMYLICYGIGRFLVEFLRNDYRGEVGIFSTSQFISIGIVAAGLILFAAAGKMAGKTEEE